MYIALGESEQQQIRADWKRWQIDTLNGGAANALQKAWQARRGASFDINPTDRDDTDFRYAMALEGLTDGNVRAICREILAERAA